MVKRYTNKQWSSAPLDDCSVHLISYMGVANPAMIRPSKQGQRLGREILYMPIDKARKKGIQLESSKTHILRSSQVLAILTLASKTCWQVPHWCPYFLFDLSLDQVNSWTIPVWTNLFTDNPSIINFFF